MDKSEVNNNTWSSCHICKVQFNSVFQMNQHISQHQYLEQCNYWLSLSKDQGANVSSESVSQVTFSTLSPLLKNIPSSSNMNPQNHPDLTHQLMIQPMTSVSAINNLQPMLDNLPSYIPKPDLVLSTQASAPSLAIDLPDLTMFVPRKRLFLRRNVKKSLKNRLKHPGK